MRPRDPAQEVWTGRRAGIEGARERRCVSWIQPMSLRSKSASRPEA
ncbi:MAG TPA: hypothetical protein VFF36_10350 [Planctomycetota bacterium]|nr:hypothetical protein [Planctomycetota bacterium]